MDALELAYTPHPAMRTRVSLNAPSAPSCREKETAGLAVAAVASLALIGAGAVLASPAVTEAPETVAGEARPFERREAAQAAALTPSAPASAFLPMPLSADPTPVETRSASPAPLLGDLGPEPEPAAPASVAYAPREQHVLTSFDGTRTLSDGPVITRVAAQTAAPEPRPFRPAPVVWNAPIQWISVHKAGL